MGQLGGRRRDPRRGHRTLHRPGPAALHRLRGPLVLGEGPVHHPAAPAGPTAGGRPGPCPRWPSGWPPGSADVVFVTPEVAEGRGPSWPGSVPKRRRSAGPVRPCWSSPTWSSSSTPPPPGPRSARPTSTGSTAGPYRSDAHDLHRDPGRARRPAGRWPAAGDRRLPPPARGHPRDLEADHPPRWCRWPATAGSSGRRHRGEPTLRERLGLPRPAEPVRRMPDRPRPDVQADPPGRPLPRGQQHHGVERPRSRAARSSSPRS